MVVFTPLSTAIPTEGCEPAEQFSQIPFEVRFPSEGNGTNAAVINTVSGHA